MWTAKSSLLEIGLVCDVVKLCEFPRRGIAALQFLAIDDTEDHVPLLEEHLDTAVVDAAQLVVQDVDRGRRYFGLRAKDLRQRVGFEGSAMEELERVEEPVHAGLINRHRPDNLEPATLEALWPKEFELGLKRDRLEIPRPVFGRGEPQIHHLCPINANANHLLDRLKRFCGSQFAGFARQIRSELFYKGLQPVGRGNDTGAFVFDYPEAIDCVGAA